MIQFRRRFFPERSRRLPLLHWLWWVLALGLLFLLVIIYRLLPR